MTGGELVIKKKLQRRETIWAGLEWWVRAFLEDTQQGVKGGTDSATSWNLPCDGIKMSTILLILILYILILVDRFSGFISISFGISVLLPLNFTNLLGSFLFMNLAHWRQRWPATDEKVLKSHIPWWWLQRLVSALLYIMGLFFFPLAKSSDWSPKWRERIVISQYNRYENLPQKINFSVASADCLWSQWHQTMLLRTLTWFSFF